MLRPRLANAIFRSWMPLLDSGFKPARLLKVPTSPIDGYSATWKMAPNPLLLRLAGKNGIFTSIRGSGHYELARQDALDAER